MTHDEYNERLPDGFYLGATQTLSPRLTTRVNQAFAKTNAGIIDRQLRSLNFGIKDEGPGYMPNKTQELEAAEVIASNANNAYANGVVQSTHQDWNNIALLTDIYDLLRFRKSDDATFENFDANARNLLKALQNGSDLGVRTYADSIRYGSEIDETSPIKVPSFIVRPYFIALGVASEDASEIFKAKEFANLDYAKGQTLDSLAKGVNADVRLALSGTQDLNWREYERKVDEAKAIYRR